MAGSNAWASRPGEDDRKFVRGLHPAHADGAERLHGVDGHRDIPIGAQPHDERVPIPSQLAHHRVPRLALAARDHIQQWCGEREAYGIAGHAGTGVADEGLATNPDVVGEAVTRLRWFAWERAEPVTGWVLRIAVEDPASGRAWALDAHDPANGAAADDT